MPRPDIVDDLGRYEDRLRRFAAHNLYGVAFDPFLVRTASRPLIPFGAMGNESTARARFGRE
jgi:hypothetical protein